MKEWLTQWLEKKRYYREARLGNIGGTADFFCLCYRSYLGGEFARLANGPNPNQTLRVLELNRLFDSIICARFEAVPDPIKENELRRQELTKFGAFGFIVSILKVEAELHLNHDYFISIWFEVIEDILQKEWVAKWVRRGEKLDHWDRAELITFMKQEPI